MHRAAFRISIINGFFSILITILAAIALSLLKYKFETISVFLLLIIFLGFFVVSKIILTKELNRENLIVVKMKNEHYEETRSIMPLVWGYFWRACLITLITNNIINFLYENYNLKTPENNGFINLLVWLVTSYFALIWLIKQQYGNTRIIIKDNQIKFGEIQTAEESPTEQKFSIGNKFKNFISNFLSFGFFVLMIFYSIGILYWLWMAIKIGSFLMFVLGILPPVMFFTGIIGAYSLIFGLPHWVFAFFS